MKSAEKQKKSKSFGLNLRQGAGAHMGLRPVCVKVLGGGVDGALTYSSHFDGSSHTVSHKY